VKGNIFIKSKAKVKNYMTNKNLERFEKSRSKKLGKPYIPASKKNKGFKKYDSSYKRTESPFTLLKNGKYDGPTAGRPAKTSGIRTYSPEELKKRRKELGINKYGAYSFRSPALEYVSGGAAKLLGGAAKMAYNIFKRAKPAKVGSKARKNIENKK
tara:strand:+ start:753 stop:1220 length:468 start_codon:yes stop_codon:yes gene_type:complete